MKRLIQSLRSISKVYVLAAIIIVVGLAIMIPKGLGMFEFFREINYAGSNHFQAGNPSTDLIRPWMSIRYIAVAYGVPQEYLYDAVHIRPSPETSMLAITRLNRQLKLGKTNDEPQLMQVIRDAVIKYRKEPLITGLLEGRVEGWMTVQYISNSTGIPMEEIFKGISLPMEGNQYLILDFMSDSLHYPGGKKALIAAIQAVVDAHKTQP
jgi:hypothetical protein